MIIVLLFFIPFDYDCFAQFGDNLNFYKTLISWF